jgi:putative transposase
LNSALCCFLFTPTSHPFWTGRKELVGFTDGIRESSQSWRDLLLDLKRRGLTTAPQIAVADGALEFWKALGEVWPTTREQRCWVHKTGDGSHAGR